MCHFPDVETLFVYVCLSLPLRLNSCRGPFAKIEHVQLLLSDGKRSVNKVLTFPSCRRAGREPDLQPTEAQVFTPSPRVAAFTEEAAQQLQQLTR